MNIYIIPKATVKYEQFLLINTIEDIENYIDKGIQIKIKEFNQFNTENLLNLYNNQMYYYKIL